MEKGIIITLGATLLIVGLIGVPSALHEPVNTATVVYVTGWILLAIGLHKD